MAWLPDGEKNSKISLFILTQLTNVTDTQTDGQTPHDSIGRAYAYASRGKNYNSNYINTLFLSPPQTPPLWL